MSFGQQNYNFTSRNRTGIFPLFFFLVWVISQLAVFWFGYYRILVFSNISLLLILVAANVVSKPCGKYRLGIYVSFILIYIWIFISCSWSPDPAASYEQAFNAAISAIPAFAAAEILARRYPLRTIFIGFSIFPILFGFQVIYNYFVFNDPAIYDIYSIRTIAGAIFSVLASLFFGLAIFERSKLNLFFAAISCAIIIFLESRAGTLAIGLGLLSLIFLYSRKLFIKICLFSLPLFAVVMAMGGDVLTSRFSSADTDMSIGTSVLGDLAVDQSLRVDFDRRLHTFIAIEMLEANPVFGGGYLSIFLNNKYEFNIELSAHGFLGMFAEIGLIGFFLFMSFIYQIWKGMKANFYSSTAKWKFDYLDKILLVMVGLAIFVGFFHQVFESSFFGIIMGLLAGRAGRYYSGRQGE